MALLRPYPRALIAIYVSFSSFLLFILGVLGYVFSLAGPTTGGKTTTLRGAASVWGNPDESSQAAAVAVWDATFVWIERALTILKSIPLILDDTKRARHPQDVPEVAYLVQSGHGRGRGSPQGIRSSGSWRTPMLSSGETTMTSMSQDGGVRRGCLNCGAAPLAKRTSRRRRSLLALMRRCCEIMGMPARAVWLSCWLTYSTCRHRAYFEQRRQHFLERAGANHVAGRLAPTLAVIDVGAELMHQALALPWQYEYLTDALFDELVAETVEADRAAAALRYVVSWCNSRREEFVDERRVGSAPPINGWLGKWRICSHAEPGAECLGIYPHKLREAIEEGHFDPDATRRLWRDKGWLRTSSRRGTLKATITFQSQSFRVELVGIRWTAIDAVSNGDDDVDEPEAVGRSGQIR